MTNLFVQTGRPSALVQPVYNDDGHYGGIPTGEGIPVLPSWW